MIDPQKIRISPIAKTERRNPISNFQYLKIAVRQYEKLANSRFFPNTPQDMKAGKS